MPHIRRKRAYCICVHEFGYLKKKKKTWNGLLKAD